MVLDVSNSMTALDSHVILFHRLYESLLYLIPAIARPLSVPNSESEEPRQLQPSLTLSIVAASNSVSSLFCLVHAVDLKTQNALHIARQACRALSLLETHLVEQAHDESQAESPTRMLSDTLSQAVSVFELLPPTGARTMLLLTDAVTTFVADENRDPSQSLEELARADVACHVLTLGYLAEGSPHVFGFLPDAESLMHVAEVLSSPSRP